MDGYIVIETDKYYSKGREELFTIDYPFTDRFDPDVVLKEHEKIIIKASMGDCTLSGDCLW